MFFQSGVSPDGWVLRDGGSVSEKLWQAHVSKKRVTPWYLRARGKIVSEWQHQEFGNRHTETPCKVPCNKWPQCPELLVPYHFSLDAIYSQ